MAQMPVEIIDLSERYTQELWQAVAIANQIQQSFSFSSIESTFREDLRLLCFRVIKTSNFFDIFESKRMNFRGFHPYMITFVDSELESEKWSNLFSE